MNFDDFVEACGGEPYEVLSDIDNAISELVDTGSVTVEIRGVKFILTLTADRV